VLVNPVAGAWYGPVSMPVSAHPPVTCRGSSRALADAPFLMPLTQASPAGWAGLIREALSCGLFRLDGRAGTGAIRLIATPAEVRQQHGAHEVLWVSPKTFLPVRMSFGPGAVSAAFSWLPPTAANLAKLRVTAPHQALGHRLPAGTGILVWQVYYWD